MESSVRIYYAEHQGTNSKLWTAEKEAAEEAKELREYTVRNFKGELSFDSAQDSILFFISDKDLSKREKLRKMKRSIIMNYDYAIRVAKLNELIAANAHIKYLKDKAK